MFQGSSGQPVAMVYFAQSSKLSLNAKKAPVGGESGSTDNKILSLEF